MNKEQLALPYKAKVLLEKWEDYRSPDDGEPDEVIETEMWFDSDGQVVTDPRRIEQLEARLQEDIEPED